MLDLTRAVAGPVAGRSLASHRADVMLVTAPHLPSILPLTMDTGRGKLSAQLDLRQAAARETLRGLSSTADVFLQGYRPGAVAGYGFSPEELAAIRPGMVCVTFSAYGHSGPWRGRRGFDSLVQNANGMNLAEAEAAGEAKPKPLPCQTNDHASGYLLAFGAMVGPYRRATEGGAWHVRVGFAPTAHWIRSLGRLEGGLAAPDTLGIRCHGSIGANRQRLWPPQGCAGRRADVSNTAILEPPKCSAWNSCPKLGSRYGTVRWVPASRWPNKSAAVAWFRFVDTREELILPGPHAERTADTEAARGNQQLDELDDSSGVRAITSRFRHHR